MKKYIERRLEGAVPGILVFREKHGTRYFMCNSREDFYRAAMKILKERADKKYSWYYEDPTEPETDLNRAKEIIANNDLEAAYEFMELRSDWEYEGMDIEYPEKF